MRQGFGEVFPPLPSELWDRHGGLDPVWIGSKPESAIQPKTRGKQWRRRELNANDRKHARVGKDSRLASPTSSDRSEPSRSHDGSPGASRRFADPNAKPITLDVLRARLDAAIVDSAWGAVAAIGRRFAEFEKRPVGSNGADAAPEAATGAFMDMASRR